MSDIVSKRWSGLAHISVLMMMMMMMVMMVMMMMVMMVMMTTMGTARPQLSEAVVHWQSIYGPQVADKIRLCTI